MTTRTNSEIIERMRGLWRHQDELLTELEQGITSESAQTTPPDDVAEIADFPELTKTPQKSGQSTDDFIKNLQFDL